MPPYLVQCSSKQCIATWGQGAREAIASSSEQKSWLWRTHFPIISPYFPASSVARWTPPRFVSCTTQQHWNSGGTPRKQRRQVDAPAVRQLRGLGAA